FSHLLIVPSLTYFYPLSLHDALPILPVQLANFLVRSAPEERRFGSGRALETRALRSVADDRQWNAREPGGVNRDVDPFVRNERRDRKSTRLNSSHQIISYAVFCLKKK